MTSTQTCVNCGRPCSQGAIVCPVPGYPEEPLHAITLCTQCYSAFGTCNACQHASACAFDAYTGPLPKVVTRTIQQGNMIAQTQIPNPEIIKQTCIDKCPCCDNSDLTSGPICYRKANNLCTNYEEVDLSVFIRD